MSYKNIYQLHRADGRLNFYKSNQELIWLSDCQKWICCNPKLINLILRDNNFLVINSAPRAIIDRLKIDLNEICKISSYLPMSNNGEHHKVLRKRFALQISKNSTDALAFFKKNLKKRLNELLRSNVPIDFYNELLEPLISETIKILAQFDYSKLDDISKLSSIFDETSSLQSRINLNKFIKDMVSSQKNKDSEDDIYFKIALLTAGNDTLLGTIASSILSVLIRNQNAQLSSINWDINFPATGIPVVERFANEDSNKYGVNISKGQKVRMYLDAAGYISSEYSQYSQLFFAAGSHLCPGMAFGNDIWRILSDELKTINQRVHIENVSFRKADNVFNTYELITLSFL